MDAILHIDLNPVSAVFIGFPILLAIFVITVCERLSYQANGANSPYASCSTDATWGANMWWRFLFLCLISLAAIVSSVVIREKASGWMIIIFSGAYLIFLAYHLWVHVRLARVVPRLTLRDMWLIAISHCALIIGFLLQWDIGDLYSWLVITALLGEGPGYQSSLPPTWLRFLLKSEPFGMMGWSFLVLTPAFVSWHFLNRSYRLISS